MAKDWKGDIVFTDKVAIFRGHVGDNRRHSHWASQLTIAVEGEVEFEVQTGAGCAKAVYIASKTEHRLLSGFICSIYFDPLIDSILKALGIDTVEGWAALSTEELPNMLSSITASTDLRALLESESLRSLGLSNSADQRLQSVLDVINQDIRLGQNSDRGTLARLINLSPTRFSHWFVEQTGMPLRSYKKWLKLRVAMDALLDAHTPMEAAMMAGFSDLPHMSREFSESFGLTYLDAQRVWEQSTKS